MSIIDKIPHNVKLLNYFLRSIKKVFSMQSREVHRVQKFHTGRQTTSFRFLSTLPPGAQFTN